MAQPRVTLPHDCWSTAERCADAGLPSTTILVVDDEALLAEELCDALSCDGFAAESVLTAAEAERRLSTTPRIGLVITDFHLPDMSGLDLARRIGRRGDGTWRPAVILLSGEATEAIRTEARASGVSHVIGKPFTLSQIRAAIGEWLDQRAAQPAP